MAMAATPVRWQTGTAQGSGLSRSALFGPRGRARQAGVRLGCAIEAQAQLAAGRSEDDVILLDAGDAQARHYLTAKGDEPLPAIGR